MKWTQHQLGLVWTQVSNSLGTRRHHRLWGPCACAATINTREQDETHFLDAIASPSTQPCRTQSKIKDTSLSRSVSKILTVWRLKKVYFCPYVRFVEMGQNSDFLEKKVPKKQCFLVTRFLITWLWRGEAPKFFEVLATFTGVLKNTGHKLSDEP